jgi:hypothetical protein
MTPANARITRQPQLHRGRAPGRRSLAGAGLRRDQGIAARLAIEESRPQKIGVNLVRVTEQTVRSIRPTLMVLIGGVALLLLITAQTSRRF